jgi:hypothetical protein
MPEDEGHNYLLNIIDIYSRYGFGFGLRTTLLANSLDFLGNIFSHKVGIMVLADNKMHAPFS